MDVADFLEGQVRKFIGTDLESKAKDAAFGILADVVDSGVKALLYDYLIPVLRGQPEPVRLTDEQRDAIAAHFNKLELEEGKGL